MTLLQGCTNFILEPVLRGFVAKAAGCEWSPACSEWYCPRPPYLPPLSVPLIPEDGHEMDIVEILAIALNNHPQTRQAWAQARAAAFNVGIAESAFYPTVTASEALLYGNSTSTTAATAGNIISVGAETNAIIGNLFVNYLILDFGGRNAAVWSAWYALQALNWTQNTVIQSVIFGVMQAYYGYIESKGIVAARADDLKDAEINLSAAVDLQKWGVASDLDVLQASANRENALLGLVTATAEEYTNLGALAVSLGIPPSIPLAVKDLPIEFPMEDIKADVCQLMEIARKNRPDLAAAYAQVLESKMNVFSAISASLPTLTADINLQQSTFFNHTGISGHNYVGIISLNFPIFNGFLYENQIEQSKELLRAAAANYQNLETLALQDVLTGYNNFATASEGLEYSEKYLIFAEEAYTAALVGYRNGTASLVDLMNACATLSDARSQRVTSRTNWAVSLFNVAYVTGTLNLPFVQGQLESAPFESAPEEGCGCDYEE